MCDVCAFPPSGLSSSPPKVASSHHGLRRAPPLELQLSRRHTPSLRLAMPESEMTPAKKEGARNMSLTCAEVGTVEFMVAGGLDDPDARFVFMEACGCRLKP